MIIAMFNPVFMVYLLLIVLTIVLIWFFLRKKSESTRKWVIIGLCLFNILFFFIYKGFLSSDKEYRTIQDFSWWSELPLQLCNINMFIIPAALLSRKRFLAGFSFFIAPLGALMAIMFPEPAFTGYSVFLMRNIGFYTTHGLLIVLGICLCTLGFFRPNFKIMPKMLLTLVIASLLMHGFNTLLRSTVCNNANYFYTYPTDISILKLFYSWLPVPYLYEIFGIGILGIYASLVTLPFVIFKKGTKEN
jgi:uncharacterized membrane protein YwaF